MLFVYWTVFNLLLPRRAVFASFQSGKSSSIGVLSSSSFPSEASENLPFSGTTEIKPECGWIFAAAGSTAPGYFRLANFGTFNVGSKNIGQANVGYGNIGFGNYGQNNTGRLNNGNNNIGYLNDGYNNTGALNIGTDNIGDANSGTQCIGYNNGQCSSVIGTFTTLTKFSIGTELEGNFIFGSNSTGNGQIGQGNQNQFSIGFQNENGSLNGNIGVLNNGDGLVGYNNTGTNMIGQDSIGQDSIGLYNNGEYEIGYNNSGNTHLIGLNQRGRDDIGVSNLGDSLTGFELTGSNFIGGTFIDTSSVPLSQEIVFDPQIISEQNIGTNYNAQPVVNENQTGVNTPFIKQISAIWSFYLEFPAILSVVDLGCPGDLIQVYDASGNVIILVTSIPSPNPLAPCIGLNDPDEALADPIYSRGFVTLQPGSHFLSFSLLNGNSGTSLAFRLDYIKPPVICKECDLPVPLLDRFHDKPIIDDPPFFTLPEDIKMYTQTEECAHATSENDGGSSQESTVTASTNSTSTSNNKTNLWCQSKRFQMLRDSFLSHSEASILCKKVSDGLAKPTSPATQLEITSLLFQCQPPSNTTSQPESLWIGSDWKGNEHRGCLMTRGENVIKSKDCDIKRRFICNK